MIVDYGSLSLGVVVPGAANAAVAIDVACGVAAPNVSAQLTALATFTPSASLGLAAQLDLAQAIVANIQSAIALGLESPSLDAQVAAAAAITADLQAKLLTVQAQVDIAVELQGMLATGGVRLLKFVGTQDAFGAELAAELGPATTATYALVLLTNGGAAWTAVQGVFKTS
ncbi:MULTISPECIES: hypothetical protein [Sorangium]|uniref:Uncharacterized protein n=1 Tax=Sorangium cellulosum TaxID=56 RepID=A0A4P2QSF7_SORCE|nr:MULTISPECIES: hypothetical protein [Sorangium]AUX33155.1 uncharacterized protein SOCE836_053090 [Sorangium cellulosum]AUX33212.1 uncharacterized protein SOCE836_053660 [Sorangium cellulosum]WCQ92531.1 hypothetical protein NQZ70_05272 [Sorangium sp. Soce836]